MYPFTNYVGAPHNGTEPAANGDEREREKRKVDENVEQENALYRNRLHKKHATFVKRERVREIRSCHGRLEKGKRGRY
ncbi:hypothetical protein Trydic_g5928 [Trypoxylus dichotomus]